MMESSRDARRVWQIPIAQHPWSLADSVAVTPVSARLKQVHVAPALGKSGSWVLPERCTAMFPEYPWFSFLFEIGFILALIWALGQVLKDMAGEDRQDAGSHDDFQNFSNETR